MQIREAINKAKEELKAVVGREVSSVSGASKVEGGWQVLVELIERKAVPDSQDLLGLYEVRLDEEGNLASFERRKVRHRMDVEEVE